MKRSKRKGHEEEKYVLERLTEYLFEDLSLTSNSGARFSNGDISSNSIYVEVKSTQKKSFSLKRDLLDKVDREAYLQGKLPLLAVLFGSIKQPSSIDTYVVMSLDTLEKLKSFWKEEK